MYTCSLFSTKKARTVYASIHVSYYVLVKCLRFEIFLIRRSLFLAQHIVVAFGCVIIVNVTYCSTLHLHCKFMIMCQGIVGYCWKQWGGGGGGGVTLLLSSISSLSRKIQEPFKIHLLKHHSALMPVIITLKCCFLDWI